MPQLPKCGWFGHCRGCDVPTMREGRLHKKKKIETYFVCFQCRSLMLAHARERFGKIRSYTETVDCIDIVV